MATADWNRCKSSPNGNVAAHLPKGGVTEVGKRWRHDVSPEGVVIMLVGIMFVQKTAVRDVLA
eukprot:6585043-Alexandrium_andersonii.AAC.1